MKNKGFTLVELLAVIVIMALLLTVAVPSVIGVANKIRTNMFCSKVKDIESAAKLYGNDYIDEINNSKTITVQDLINNNMYKKESNDCVLNDPTGEKPCVKDPRDNSKMDNKQIIISIKNKRVTAQYQYKDEEEKNSCK